MGNIEFFYTELRSGCVFLKEREKERNFLRLGKRAIWCLAICFILIMYSLLDIYSLQKDRQVYNISNIVNVLLFRIFSGDRFGDHLTNSSRKEPDSHFCRSTHIIKFSKIVFLEIARSWRQRLLSTESKRRQIMKAVFIRLSFYLDQW